MLQNKQRVLLFTSSFMDIYKDVLDCLENLGYEVYWVEASVVPNNPFNKLNGLYNEDNISKYMELTKNIWLDRFNNLQFQKPFDYLFVINGLDIHPILFDFLKEKNPKIKSMLFLYDKVNGVIQIDRFFKYYDRVFSFDKGDCKTYNIKFLPIYWLNNGNNNDLIKYDIFGFASSSITKTDRDEIYYKIWKISAKLKLNNYIKLYTEDLANGRIFAIVKHLIKKILNKPHISIKKIIKGIYTSRSLSPKNYRKLINNSKVILDTQAHYQDGLTARFMWAIGEGKKIITTNQSALTYDFYDSNQIFILNENFDKIEQFIKTPIRLTENYYNKILPYRIDNWIKTILEIQD